MLQLKRESKMLFMGCMFSHLIFKNLNALLILDSQKSYKDITESFSIPLIQLLPSLIAYMSMRVASFSW